MSPATSTQVRRRQAARRDAVERQRRLNEERRRRDEAEVEFAADFALYHDEWVAAREALAAAEAAMGRVVDQLIGELRVRYPRAAQLLDVAEDELRRLRQLAANPAANTDPRRHDDRTGAEERAERPTERPGVPKRGRTRARREPSVTATAATGTAAAQTPASAADMPSGKGPQRNVSRDSPSGTPGDLPGDVPGGVPGGVTSAGESG